MLEKEKERMKEMDLKEIFKEEMKKEIDTVKGSAGVYIAETLLPAGKQAVVEIQDELYAEGKASGSVWVKVRNRMIGWGAGLFWKIVQSAVLRMAREK